MKLILCDKDMRYLECFMEYLETKEDCKLELLGFSDTKTLLEYGERGPKIQVLVISEEMYEKGLEELANKTLVLDEGMGKQTLQAIKVDKYQSAREIYRFVLEMCIEENMVSAVPTTGKQARILGFYSPVKRVMQTSFALSLGKSLATRYKVLYLNFEVYAGWKESMQKDGDKDLYDLLYYLKESKDKFFSRFSQVEQLNGQLSYVPPVHMGQNLVYVTIKEWMMLISKLKEMGKFDFILLDLSDSLQGVFQILRTCEKVFTVTLHDSLALSKVEQYEYLLRLYEYDDVMEKSVYKKPPEFEKIPDEGDWWTHDMWRQFIQKVEIEDLGIKA